MRAERIFVAGLVAIGLAGCNREARTLAPELPLTSPHSADDPRISYYQENSYQISQGGRYFTWYGCSGCHSEGAHGHLSLLSGHRRRGDAFDRVYRAIADDHGKLAYGVRVPQQQLWQMTAYVRDLPLENSEKLFRQDLDQKGEPTGTSWTGPVR